MRHLALLLGLSAILCPGEVSAQQPPPPAGASSASGGSSAPAAAPPAAQPGTPPPPPPGGPPPPGYGAPPPGYGYGPPPPGYGYPPPPGYGYPPPGYAPPPGYYYYPPPGEAPETTKRNSTGLMVGGIVTTSVGAVLVGVGAVLFADADNQPQFDCACVGGGQPCGCPDTASSADDQKTAAIAVMVIGGVLAAGGIPMIVIGAHKVPIEPAEQKPASLVPEVRLSASRAALRWSF